MVLLLFLEGFGPDINDISFMHMQVLVHICGHIMGGTCGFALVYRLTQVVVACGWL